MEPKPHQRDAIAAAVAALTNAVRAQVVMACGTGKTLVGQRVAEHYWLPDGVVLVLCPTIALTHQTLEEWR